MSQRSSRIPFSKQSFTHKANNKTSLSKTMRSNPHPYPFPFFQKRFTLDSKQSAGILPSKNWQIHSGIDFFIEETDSDKDKKINNKETLFYDTLIT